MAGAEKEMLEVLKKVQDNPPKDVARYDFILKQAVETTADCLEQAQQDAGARAAKVQAEEAKEKKELESLTSPKDLEAQKAAEKKAAAEEGKRKAPALRGKGEPAKPQ